MLKLKQPILLNNGRQPLSFSTVFQEKLLSNYDALPARVTPKDLVLLTVSPAGLPEDLGGMTTIAVANTSQSNVQEVTLNAVSYTQLYFSGTSYAAVQRDDLTAAADELAALMLSA